MPRPHLEIALEYARRGWLVLPLHRIFDERCSCGRPGCTQLGKHPDTRHGVHDATADEQVIRGHWTRAPDAGIALAPGGARSRFAVLDLDVKDGGEASLVAFERERGPLPETLIAKTGGGGRHFYFVCEDEGLRTRFGFRPGLDFLAQGGNFVVAPPSVHRSGNLYAWENWETPLAPMPDSLLLEARPPPKRTLHLSLGDHSQERRVMRCEAFMERVAPAIEGQGGWKSTNGVCGIGGDFGLEPGEFWPILLTWNGRCEPPWDEPELWRKLEAIHERRDQPFGYRLDEQRERDPITYVEHERPYAPPIGDPTPPPPPPGDRDAPEEGPATRYVSHGQDAPEPPPPSDADVPFDPPAKAPGKRTAKGKGGKKGAKKADRPIDPQNPEEGLTDFRVSKVKIYDSDPPYYTFEIEGTYEIELGPAHLDSFKMFRRRYMEVLHRRPSLPTMDWQWNILVNYWLSGAEIIKQPTEASSFGMLLEEIRYILRNMTVGDRVDELDHGRILAIPAKPGTYCVKAGELHKELKNRLGKPIEANHLSVAMTKLGATHGRPGFGADPRRPRVWMFELALEEPDFDGGDDADSEGGGSDDDGIPLLHPPRE
jgi:hypothetical protein